MIGNVSRRVREGGAGKGPQGTSPASYLGLKGHDQAYDRLTPRQREVATLIARGHSNRQIGDALVITERTVAAHVEHILNKLSFASRTQIGVCASEHGLLVSSSA